MTIKITKKAKLQDLKDKFSEYARFTDFDNHLNLDVEAGVCDVLLQRFQRHVLDYNYTINTRIEGR